MKRLFTNEDGSILIMGTVVILILLALSALAIDGGNLFLSQLRTQRAVDAASISVAPLLRNLDEAHNSNIEDIAERVAQANLDLHNIKCPNAPGGICAEATVGRNPENGLRIINVKAAPDISHFLAQAVPGISDSTAVNAEATAERGKFAVALVLDRSGSMCGDMDDGVTDPGPVYCSRINALKDAAVGFIKDFDEKSDYLSIVMFSSPGSDDAETIVPLCLQSDEYKHGNSPDARCAPLSGTGKNFERTSIEQKIRNTRAIRLTKTNIQDGILKGIEQLSVLSQNDVDGITKVMLVMTDGQPIGSNEFRGPPFVPNDDPEGSGPYVNPYSSDSPPFTNRERYFDRAIIASDVARNPNTNGIAIYTVGFGTEDANTGNPYQHAISNSIKSYFLRRLANDQSGHIDSNTRREDPQFGYEHRPAVRSRVSARNLNPDDTPEFGGSYAQLNARKDFKGEYFHATDPAELIKAFQDIADKVKIIRLIK